MLTCTRHNKRFFELAFVVALSDEYEYILAGHGPEMGQIAASRLSAKARVVDKPRTKQQTTNLTSAGFTQHFGQSNQRNLN
jgi:hypothetical protein